MPVEKKRLLIVLSASGAFIVGILVLLLFVFWPKVPSSPATFGAQADLRSNAADSLVTFPAKREEPAPTTGLEASPGTGAYSVDLSGENASAAIPSSPATTASSTTTDSAAASTKATASTPATATKATASPKPAASSTKAAPAIVIVTEYWIQVTSVASSTQAEDFKAFLARQGITAVINTATPFGTTVYRIIIGPYATHKEAEGWLPKFKSIEGCEDSFIVEFKAARSK